MKLNRNELRKTLNNFNSVSNRLLQADFHDYLDVLQKFIVFLQNTPIIYEYILDCGECEQDVEQEVKAVQHGSGRAIFSVGESDSEEVRNVYALLKYISDNSIEVHYSIAWGYSSSTKYQDRIKDFNHRFVLILIRHIENFLTNAGIDMGLDDKISYNVTVQNGQAIFAGDNATITATNQIGLDMTELQKLLRDVKDASAGLSAEDTETVNDCLEVVEAEAKSKTPKKSFIKTAITTLKAIKGTAEFAAAIAALIQFISTLI